MYRVLLPIDESSDRARRAVETVLELPTDSGNLEVVVLNVFTEFDVADEGAKISSDEFYDETDFPVSVETAVELLEEAGVTVQAKRTHGDPDEEITEFAESIDANCIALTGRKRSPAGKVIFGSVTQSVLLSADRPVIVTMDE